MLLLNYKTRIWSERTPHMHLTQKQKKKGGGGRGGQVLWSVPSPPGTIPQLIVLPDKQRPRNGWHFHHLHLKKKKEKQDKWRKKEETHALSPYLFRKAASAPLRLQEAPPCTQPRAGLTRVIWLRWLCSLCYIKKRGDWGILMVNVAQSVLRSPVFALPLFFVWPEERKA